MFFSWASVFGLAPPPYQACNNTATNLSDQTQPCPEGSLQTGITCSTAECGRPSDWPQDEPFFLPFDMLNATVWQEVGAGLSQARAKAGLPRDLSHLEMAHLQVQAPPLHASALCTPNSRFHSR